MPSQNLPRITHETKERLSTPQKEKIRKREERRRARDLARNLFPVDHDKTQVKDVQNGEETYLNTESSYNDAADNFFPTDNEMQGCSSDRPMTEFSADENDAAMALLDLKNDNRFSSIRSPLTADTGTQTINYGSGSGGILIDDLIQTERQLTAFTGIPNFSFLRTLCETIEFALLQVKSNENIYKLHIEHRIILTLIKLKTNQCFEIIASYFGISRATCISYFERTVQILAATLEGFIPWPDKRTILNNLPKDFEKYPDTRVVLDCTEIATAKHSCPACQLQTFSYYKSTNTVKILLGIAPSGLITFVSKAMGGKASDKFIFNHSRIAYKCQPRDAIMCDKGFQIEEECAALNLKLIRPPFIKGGNPLTAEEAEENQNIARARVHVERSIQRMKVFKILKPVLGSNLLPVIDDIIITICALVNLSSPILSDERFLTN